MDKKLRGAFDKIHCEDDLKAITARWLQRKIERRQVRRRAFFRFAAACTALLLITLPCGVFFGLYFTPGAYMDLDVNPSIELTLNHFSRVIGSHAYNSDGAAVLRGVNVQHKTYGEAAGILLGAAISSGYLAEDGLVSVTVQAKNGGAESGMIGQLERAVAASLSAYRVNARADVYSVSEDVRNTALAHHVTPAKYLAITELQAVDPAATFESCAGHSVSEIKELTQGHGENHHNGLHSAPEDGEHASAHSEDHVCEEEHSDAHVCGGRAHSDARD